ncbi:hypothetical protein ACFL6A_04515, partial [bacterium]
LEAYPWFRCPVFDLRMGEKEGVLLAVKRDGTLTAGLGRPMDWVEIAGPRVSLKQWIMVSLVVNQGGMASLYVNEFIKWVSKLRIARYSGGQLITD